MEQTTPVVMIDEYGKLHKNIRKDAGGVYANMVEVLPEKLDALEALPRERRHPVELRERTDTEIAEKNQSDLDEVKQTWRREIDKLTGQRIMIRIGGIDAAPGQHAQKIADIVKEETDAAQPTRQQIDDAFSVKEVSQIFIPRKP